MSSGKNQLIEVQRISFFDYPENTHSWRKLLPYLLLLSVTLALYATTIYFDFVWDDFYYVVQNSRIANLSLAALRRIWTQPYFGQYAPLHISFLAVVHSFSGLNPVGYHVGQLLLQCTCVCLLYRVLERLESARVALLASLLFAVYPPNIETIAWISETKSTLALIFFLFSFWFFLRFRNGDRWTDGVLCGVFLALSLLSKINTVVAPAIFLLYDYRQGYAFKKGRAWSLVSYFLISAIFTAIHLAISNQLIHASPGFLVDEVLTDGRLPISVDSWGYLGGASFRLLNMPRLLLFYVRMLIFPSPLSGWHMLRVFGDLNWITGGAWIALLGLIWLLYRSRRDLQFWELWFLIFLAPVLQIVPNSIWVAERYLYIPAIGAFVLGSRLFFYFLERFSRPSSRLSWGAVMAVILVVFAWQTRNHLPVWQDDLTFWQATTKTCMTSAYCHNRLGQSLLVNGYPDPAVREFFQAVQIRPTPVNLIYLGDAYAGSFGDYRRALRAYQMAQQRGEGLPLDFSAKLAKAYYREDDLEHAQQVIERGKQFNGNDANLLLVEVFLQWKKGDRDRSKLCLQRFLALNAMSPQSLRVARLIEDYWGNPAEVSRLLADLGPL